LEKTGVHEIEQGAFLTFGGVEYAKSIEMEVYILTLLLPSLLPFMLT